MERLYEERRKNALISLRDKLLRLAKELEWEEALMHCQAEIAYAMQTGNNHRETYAIIEWVFMEAQCYGK